MSDAVLLDDDDDFSAFMPAVSKPKAVAAVAVPVTVSVAAAVTMLDDDDEDTTSSSVPATVDNTEIERLLAHIAKLEAELSLKVSQLYDLQQTVDVLTAQLQQRSQSKFDADFASILQNIDQCENNTIPTTQAVYEFHNPDTADIVLEAATEYVFDDAFPIELLSNAVPADAVEALELADSEACRSQVQSEIVSKCENQEVLAARWDSDCFGAEVHAAEANAAAADATSSSYDAIVSRSYAIAAREFTDLSASERKKLSVAATRDYAQRLNVPYKGTKAIMLENIAAAADAVLGV